MPARWLKVVAGCRDRWVDILSASYKKWAKNAKKKVGDLDQNELRIPLF